MIMPPGSNDHGLSRREFLRSAAGLAALGGLSDLGVSQEPGAIPKRKLGPIDYEVTIAALGVGAMGDGRLPEPHVLEVFQAVLERGVNYIDTASTYGDTQRMIGPLVEEWRDRIFLVSKCKEHTYDAAWAQVEQSLRDLRTDHLDLLHLHNLGDFDLDHLEEPDGTLTAMRAMKDQGIVRHLGASGHLRPPHFLRLLERVQDVEVIMVPINVVDRHTYAFDSEVVPAAKEAGLAVVAMKVLGGVTAWRYAPAQGLLIAPEYYETAMRYSLGHPSVSACVIGFSTVEELDQGLAIARDLRPLSEEELAAFEPTSRELAGQWGYHFGPPE